MKKKLRLILCCLLLSISLAGCGWSEHIEIEVIEPVPASDDRFYSISVDRDVHLYVDKETKVQYVFVLCGANRGGLTVLVDADGKPILYEGEI